MNENLNLVEILKDCPKGTKLYSTIHGEVEFRNINEEGVYKVYFKAEDGEIRGVTSDGRHLSYLNGECILFPSKYQRDWSKFKPKKPKFDPKTLQPFDKVLAFFNGIWRCDLYSHYNEDMTFHYECLLLCTNRIIPYNDDTKHLIGTSEEAPEFYRYWKE